MARGDIRRPRRRYRRRTVRVLVDYASDAGLSADPATTLGAGGLFIETEAPLPKGARLKLRFQLPGRSLVHEIEGRVVWQRWGTEPGHHAPGMGIEFTDRAAAVKLAQELEPLA
jgi:uncharacterized protein (TIGR02266 family)